ncbi:MAG: hypothetical protein BMS9Abin12_1859 [Acidimicrobiia bacterium]|nr:MAG: hypothetical protein BMS9Abin12_1859 [Acidimicrobiia bacterium]
MSAKHIAWFNFKEGVSNDRIQQHMEAVRGLVDSVPAVIEIECGPSYSDRAEASHTASSRRYHAAKHSRSTWSIPLMSRWLKRL